MNDTSLLVVSCDAYADAWPPFFHFLRKMWPDCPYAVHLLTNEAGCDDPEVRVVRTGPDVDWSSALLAGLERLDSDVVLILLDDFLLWQPVDTERIRRLESCLRDTGAAGLRLVPKPPATRSLDEAAYPGVGVIEPGSDYRLSLQAGLWHRKTLMSLLRPGESAWQAEQDGTKRTLDVERPFLSVMTAPHEQWPIHYVNAIIKRKWTPEAVHYCQEDGIRLDLSMRPSFGWYDHLRRSRPFRHVVERLAHGGRWLLGEGLYSRLKNIPLVRRIIY